MQIYAQIGTSKQKIGGNKPNDTWVQMNEVRPVEGEYIALESGIWQEVLPTIAQLKQAKIEFMNNTYEHYIQIISTEQDEDSANYAVPLSEISTFDIQKLEAEAYQLDNATPTPFIDGIAQGRQTDRISLIQKVLAKAMGYQEYVSVLTGKRQHIEDLLKQAHTIEELEQIDVIALYN